MTTLDIRAVARATGETPATIRQRGFDHFDHEDRQTEDDDLGLLAMDCPCCGAAVLLSTDGPDGLPELAECGRCDALYEYKSDEVFRLDPNDDDRPVPNDASERVFAWAA